MFILLSVFQKVINTFLSIFKDGDVLATARQKHYAIAHKRKKVTPAKVLRALSQQARNRPEDNPQHVAKRQAKSEALASKLARKLPNPNLGGHDLRVIRPNWSSWPTTSSKLRAGTLLTCCACWRASNADWDTSRCIGRGGAVSSAQRNLWRRLTASNSDNVTLLLDTWQATRDEADARFGGHRNERVGEARVPGPRFGRVGTCAQFQDVSLNCQSPNGAWFFFEECAAVQEPLVIALQKTRFSAREADAFSRLARKSGFHVHVTPGLPDAGNRPEDWFLLNFF